MGYSVLAKVGSRGAEDHRNGAFGKQVKNTPRINLRDRRVCGVPVGKICEISLRAFVTFVTFVTLFLNQPLTQTRVPGGFT